MSNMHTPQSEQAWAEEVGCNDQTIAPVGIYTLLSLIARVDNSLGYVSILKGSRSTLLFALNAADPQMRYWAMTETPVEYRVWRRKEYNESVDKQRADEIRKAALYADNAEYLEAKQSVMKIYIEMCDGDRALAERMFAPLANNRAALLRKAEIMKKL